MNSISYSPALSTPELEYQIKEINLTHNRILLLILQNPDIIYVPHLNFIWPNCLYSQESIFSFRNMRKKVYNKKGDNYTA